MNVNTIDMITLISQEGDKFNVSKLIVCQKSQDMERWISLCVFSRDVTKL